MIYTTVIIDDESFNRDLTKKFIQTLNSSFKVVGEAANADDGFDLINRTKPDLVLLDVKMPGKSGFDMLSRFENPCFEVAFITGFDEYAIKAFEYNAVDYILKPIDTDKFKIALEKIQKRLNTNLSNVNNLKQIIASYNAEDVIISKIPVHHKNAVVLLDLHEIVRVAACEGYTHFFTRDGEKYISAKKLSDFEFILNNFKGFIKIQRGVYINLKFIQSYSKGSDCILYLKDGSAFDISRRRKAEILTQLEGR